MPEEVTTTTTTGALPTAPNVVTAAPTGSGESTTAAISMTREEFNRQLADARRAAEREVKESQEVKDLRAKAKRAEELEDATKSETERLAARAEKAEQVATENAARYRDALIRSEFAMTAPSKGIPADRFKAALRLLDLDGVEVTETGEVKGLEKAIDALIRDNPFLAGQETGTTRSAPNLNGGATRQTVTQDQIIQQSIQEGRASGRYRGIL